MNPDRHRSRLHRSPVSVAMAALWIAVAGVACGGRDAPASPTASPPPAADTPAFTLRVDEGGTNRSGTNLSEPPWVSYFSCGQYRNVSFETWIVTTEMVLFGPDGRPYNTESSNEVPRRYPPDGVTTGCGLTNVRDYDSTHRVATSYRLRVNYRREDGTKSGSVEGDGTIRLTPEVTGIVINELRPRGPRGDQDQFVELLNVSASPITMRGWFLQVSTKSFEVSIGTETRIDTVTINPGCTFLLTATTPPGSSTFGTYSGSEVGDHSFRPYLTDAGGVALRADSGQVVDQVGLGSNTVYKEGTPLASFGGDNTDRSYARVGPDTGDNARDFRMVSPSTPRNSSRCR